MRVLFVYPNWETQLGFNHGLASLSAVLEEAGHDTRLVNLNENLTPVPTAEEVVELVESWEPGLVGFSALTQQYPAACELARLLRRRFGERGLELPPLVVGGIHPTLVPTEVMAAGLWDHVGVGECENALLELVQRLERGERPEHVSNFLSWKGGRRPEGGSGGPLPPELWVHNPVGEFPDLSQLPAPNYELFDIARITALKDGWFSVMSSRGCAYRCTYCLNHRIVDRYRGDLGRKVSSLGFLRCRPPELFIEEVREVLERYPGIRTLIFDDDLFTQNVEHALGICAAMREAGIEVPWVVNAHVKRLDSTLAEALPAAGAKILKMGIESGSARVRSRVLKRHMTDRDILETVAGAEEHGLHTSGFVMVGIPTETREERWETVDCLASSRIGRFRTAFFYPFPGTESLDLAIAAGQFTPELADHDSVTTFTDRSCLDFGAEENLFVDKLGKCMPWLVNARLSHFHDAPASARYQPLVDELLALDAEGWAELRPRVREIDEEYSRAATLAGEWHYAIRYNEFMGVRSDFFLREDRGESDTAISRPPASWAPWWPSPS